jgi:ABC-type multidrug transport system fused ATPase/permease subunit
MKEQGLFRSLQQILSPRQRRRYVFIQTFFIFAGILQVAGAGSVAPFVALLSRPSILHTNPIASQLYEAAGFANDTQALVAFAFVMMGALALSNLVAALTVWLTFRFSLNLGAELQRDLLNCFLRRDYARLSGTNSSDLITKVSVGAPRFSYNVMQPLMTIASQGAIALVIVVGLLLYQPQVVIVFSVLVGGGYGFLFFVVRKRLVQHGDLLWQGGQRRQRLLQESLGGLKEIRLSGTEEKYRDMYMRVANDSYASEAIVGMLADVPRFVLETIAFTALLLLAVYELNAGAEPARIIGVLSVYAMTGYRMLPAGQSIYKAVSQVRANMQVIDEILPDVLEGRRAEHDSTVRSSESTEPPQYPAEIKLHDVWFSYPSSDKPVLAGVTTTIPYNALTVLVGHSGSGKSTLSDLLLGLLQPQQGSVTVAGRPIGAMGRRWFQSVGYVPQSIFLLDDSIANNVAFGTASEPDGDKLSKALSQARLSDLVASVPEGTGYRVGERGARLSGGQRQRVGIARALYHDADFLILDEATSALDGRTESEVLETLLELRTRKTVIMIAHRLTTIQAADYIILLNDGRVEAEGTFADLLENSQTFRVLAQHVERSSDRQEAGINRHVGLNV